MELYKQNKKKGFSSIEIVIGFLIFIMMLAFLVDIVGVLVRYSVVAQANTDIARITGVQGGILSGAPTGWPGGEDNYINITELESMMNQKFVSVGVPMTDWTVKLHSTDGKTGNFGSIGRSGVQYDYLESYTVEIEVLNHWKSVSTFIPGMITQKFSSKRPAVSEWKYNYNDWIGE